MTNIKPICLDGSTLEGGGQLVRVALSLSAITGIPVYIYNIRANRAPQCRGQNQTRSKTSGVSKHSESKFNHGFHRSENSSSRKPEGGLKESHLAALQYLAHHCDAYVEGAEIGSREISFIPGANAARDSSRNSKVGKCKGKGTGNGDLVNLATNTIELKNPGSVWLVFQAILPCLLFGKPRHPSSSSTPAATGEDTDQSVVLTLRGGTNVSKSMSTEYTQQVLLPTLQRIGLPPVTIDVVQRGWAGNASQIGEVKISIPILRPPPDASGGGGGNRFTFPPFNVTDCGQLAKITISIIADPESTRQAMLNHLQLLIPRHFTTDVPIEIVLNEPSEDPRRTYILLVAHTTTGCLLGRDFLGTGKTAKNAVEGRRIVEGACEAVVRELKEELLERGGNGSGCVDEYMQDQLVVFQALAGGRSVVCGNGNVSGDGWGGSAKKARVEDEEDEDAGVDDEGGSLHTRTVRWVAERILGKKGCQV